MIARGDGRRFLRFLVSGGTGFALYYVLALVLDRKGGLGPGPSATIATLLSVPPTFLLQRSFTFRSEGSRGRQLLAYFLLQLVSSVVIGGAAYLGARASLPRGVTFFLAGIIGVLFSYAIQGSLIFKR